jgi:hypothetical protein
VFTDKVHYGPNAPFAQVVVVFYQQPLDDDDARVLVELVSPAGTVMAAAEARGPFFSPKLEFQVDLGS